MRIASDDHCWLFVDGHLWCYNIMDILTIKKTKIKSTYSLIYTSHGGFNPSEKYQSNWIVSPCTGKKKKACLKPPPSIHLIYIKKKQNKQKNIIWGKNKKPFKTPFWKKKHLVKAKEHPNKSSPNLPTRHHFVGTLPGRRPNSRRPWGEKFQGRFTIYG